MPSLPDLSYKELLSLLHHFGCKNLRGENSPVIIGRNRNGNPFTIHHHPGQKVYKAKVSKILKYLEVSQNEFWQWYHRK